MYLLLGYGFSNKQVYKFLKNKRKKIIIYDDYIDNKKPNIDFNKIKTIVVSAGIHYKHPILIKGKQLNIPIKTDLDILYKYKKKNNIFVGVTGSNGKSTTVTMISFLLNMWKINHLLCGNIGKSIFTNFYKKMIYVMEISSFQAHYMTHIEFNIGVIINISSNHDEWHEGKGSYIKAKEKLLEFSHISLSYVNKPSNFYTNNWIINNNFLTYKNNSYILNNTLQLPHNQNNFLIGLTVVEKILSILNKKIIIDDKFQEEINKFKGLSFRQEIIVNNKVLIINDSKSTNINSTITAIDSFKGKKLILIMGGIIKGNLDLINPETLKLVDSIYIFGGSKTILETHIKPFFPSYMAFDKLKDLVAYIIENKEKYYDYTLLFSPGGSSYDEFKNYIERGKFFNEIKKEFN